jgi:hypothetical protein
MTLRDRVKGWPWWAYLALLAAVAGVLWLGWWLVFGRADKAAADAATARTGQVAAVERGAAAVDAGRIIERHSEKQITIREIRDAGLSDIRAASDDAAAGAAARRALCVLDPASYGADPACGMQQAGAAGDAQAGAGQPVPNR